MTRCRFWCAYQLGDNKRYSFKLNGQFKQGLKKGDEVKENFDGKQVVYRVVTVDYAAKIYGVDYLHEIITHTSK
jgi:hypothetical protein